MNLHGLDLNLLVVLDVLLAERGVTRTSERIHLSQSATSAALSRLREYFEDDLLILVGRKMVLSPRAEALVEPVRDLLLRTEAIIKHNSIFDPSTATRNFRVMMSDYAATVLMPEIIPRMERHAPGVTIEIISELDSPTKTLDHGDIDLLIFPHEAVQSPHHPSEDLFQEDYVCIVWSQNGLIADTISLEQYLAMGHVSLKSGQQQVPTLDAVVFEKFGYQRRIEVYATAFNLVPELVVGTNRIATVHRRLAAKQAAFLPIRILEPPIAIPSFTEAVHWHKKRDNDPSIKWMRKLIHDAAIATSLQ